MSVIFPDKNISPGFYKSLNPGELLVSSIFYTIQGEGPYAGKNAIFVRLAGCNYGSKTNEVCYFCDADFAVAKARKMTVSEIMNEAKQKVFDFYANKGIKLTQGEVQNLLDSMGFIITGGEPFLQPYLADLIETVCPIFRFTQIESNGSYMSRDFYEFAIVGGRFEMFDIVISPKVVNGKYTMPNKRLQECLSYFKFLISCDPNSPYYDLPSYITECDDEFQFPSLRRIFLSPICYYKKEPFDENGNYVSILDPRAHEFYDLEKTAASHRRVGELVLLHSCRDLVKIEVNVSVQQQIFLGLP